MGVPIEPGLRSRSGWLNEAIGEVSDRPYPSSTVQPNASSTRADDIGARHLGVAHEVAVGEFGALRLAGRAGGVKDHRGVLVIPVRDLVVRVDGGQQIGKADLVDDDGVRPGLLGAAACL